MHTYSGWFLETHATSVLHHPHQVSGPTITTILRVICGMSYHELQSRWKWIRNYLPLSFPSFLGIMQGKLGRPVTQRMSFYHEYQRERKHAQLAVCPSMHINIHSGLWVCPCENTSIHCVKADKLAWNIGNTTLGTELVTKTAVSLPSDTVSLGDQLVWKHIGKKGNSKTDSLFFPDISEIQCTPTWRHIKHCSLKHS